MPWRRAVASKTLPKLARLELQILEILWARGQSSVREIQEDFPQPRPAYTTVQTTVYRLEAKGAVRRTRKIGNAHIFEPMVERELALHRLLDTIEGSLQPAPSPRDARDACLQPGVRERRQASRRGAQGDVSGVSGDDCGEHRGSRTRGLDGEASRVTGCETLQINPGILSVRGALPALIGQLLSQAVGRPVIDKTSLTGLYDFRLKWAPAP